MNAGLIIAGGALELVGVASVGQDFYGRRRAAQEHRADASKMAKALTEPMNQLEGAQSPAIYEIQQILKRLQERLAVDDVVAGCWALLGAVLVGVGIVLATVGAVT